MKKQTRESKKYLRIFLLLSIFSYMSNSFADIGISIASGHGLSNIVPIRVGVQKSFDRKFCSKWFWPVYTYVEGAFYSMNGKASTRRINSHKKIQAAVLAGVARFEKEDMESISPYIELGIGASLFSRNEIGGRELGRKFQFEDRLGFGFRFGEHRQYDISYRAVHFSNAYTNSNNHGINIHLIVLGFWFK